MFGGFQPGAFQTAFQQEAQVIAPAETPAGKAGRRRVRDIYRVTVDGRKFEFRSLAAALEFLQQAKIAAQQLAQEAARKATEQQVSSAEALPPPVIKPPEIGISSRELRAAASATKREIDTIYRQAMIDAEIAMLFELEKRQDDNDEAAMWLM